MTIQIRKYYNQAVANEPRRNWLQKENQKREQLEERQNQDLGLNPNQNLKEAKNLLVDMQLAFPEEQKLQKKFLVAEISHLVK